MGWVRDIKAAGVSAMESLSAELIFICKILFF